MTGHVPVAACARTEIPPRALVPVHTPNENDGIIDRVAIRANFSPADAKPWTVSVKESTRRILLSKNDTTVNLCYAIPRLRSRRRALAIRQSRVQRLGR